MQETPDVAVIIFGFFSSRMRQAANWNEMACGH